MGDSHLGANDVKRLHDALLNFRLASYQYDIRGAPPEVSELARAAASNGWKKIGGEVFGYATAKAHGEGWSSVWLLSFYGRVEFLCFIAPRVRVLVPCSECPPDSAN